MSRGGRRKIVPDGTERQWQGYWVVKDLGVWVSKSRLTMERRLGRELDSSELVVFVNGDASDFRPDNMEIRIRPRRRGMTGGKGKPSNLSPAGREKLRQLAKDRCAAGTFGTRSLPRADPDA